MELPNNQEATIIKPRFETVAINLLDTLMEIAMGIKELHSFPFLLQQNL